MEETKKVLKKVKRKVTKKKEEDDGEVKTKKVVKKKLLKVKKPSKEPKITSSPIITSLSPANRRKTIGSEKEAMSLSLPSTPVTKKKSSEDKKKKTVVVNPLLALKETPRTRSLTVGASPVTPKKVIVKKKSSDDKKPKDLRSRFRELLEECGENDELLIHLEDDFYQYLKERGGVNGGFKKPVLSETTKNEEGASESEEEEGEEGEEESMEEEFQKAEAKQKRESTPKRTLMDLPKLGDSQEFPVEVLVAPRVEVTRVEVPRTVESPASQQAPKVEQVQSPKVVQIQPPRIALEVQAEKTPETPTQRTPRTPRQITPRQTTPRQTTPRQITPRKTPVSTPRQGAQNSYAESNPQQEITQVEKAVVEIQATAPPTVVPEPIKAWSESPNQEVTKKEEVTKQEVPKLETKVEPKEEPDEESTALAPARPDPIEVLPSPREPKITQLMSPTDKAALREKAMERINKIKERLRTNN